MLSNNNEITIIPFDIETTGLDSKTDLIVTMQLGDDVFELHPKKHDLTPYQSKYKSVEEILNVLKDESYKKIIHNAHFEYAWILEKYGIHIENFEDTHLGAFLTYTKALIKKEKNSYYSTALKPLVKHLFGESLDEYVAFDKLGGVVAITNFLYLGQTTAKLEKALHTNTVEEKLEFIKNLDSMFKSYALEDNRYSMMVYEKITSDPLWAEISNVYKSEKKVIHPISKIESIGIQMDIEEMDRQYLEAGKELLHVEEELYEVAGKRFNPKSKEIGDVLKQAGVPLNAISIKSGDYEVNKKALASYMNYPIVRLLVKYRSLMHTRNTFIDNWRKRLDANNVIHPNIISTGATHGRMSCSNPNLMNVPKSELRKCFVPRKDFSFYMFDWSQIELVLAAYYSMDSRFLKAMRNNEDLHMQTAVLFYKKPQSEITEAERKNAKIINFLIVYGGGSKALAEFMVEKFQMPFSEAYEVAQGYIKLWYQNYSGISEINRRIKNILLTDEEQVQMHESLMKKRLAEGKSNWNLYMQRTVDEKYRGYIKNIYGRIWKPDYPSFHYKGFEALVSGTATGDMTKIAMINIQEFLERWKLESRMILPVHDEIIMEIKHGEEKIVVDHIKQIMEHFPEVTEVVPVRVDIERSSKNWWEKEEVYDSKTDAWTVEL